jgi:hypothetical protein
VWLYEGPTPGPGRTKGRRCERVLVGDFGTTDLENLTFRGTYVRQLLAAEWPGVAFTLPPPAGGEVAWNWDAAMAAADAPLNLSPLCVHEMTPAQIRRLTAEVRPEVVTITGMYDVARPPHWTRWLRRPPATTRK